MALPITQGKHDTSKDSFEILTDVNVVSQIMALKLAPSKDNPYLLEVKFRVLAGKYKNRFFWDKVCYDPANNMSWKYRALRRAAKAPYKETEPATIDIEALLLNKAIVVNLEEREYTDKNSGAQKKAQNIVYLDPVEPKATKEEPSEDTTFTDSSEEVEASIPDDNSIPTPTDEYVPPDLNDEKGWEE